MRKLRMLLGMILLISLFAGCGANADPTVDGTGEASGSNVNASDTENAENADIAADETSGEIKKVIMTYATPGVQAPDLNLVQERLNEITREAIGVEVELMPISVFEMASTVPTKVISGERIDIFMMAFTGTKLYEDMNLLEPLNDYLNENTAPYLVTYNEKNLYYDDKAENIYSIKLPLSRMSDGGFMISKSDLEAAGLANQYKDYDKITLDELGEIFAAIKAVYPEKYPCGVVGSAPRADYTFITDSLSSDSVDSGVLIGLDSTTVENYYTSEPYRDYLEHVRDWYLKGYIPKDAAVTDFSLADYLKEGIISGYFNDFKDVGMSVTTGDEYVYLQFMEYYKKTVAASANVYYGVPVTAQEPEAAMQFLNLMLSNSDVQNLLTWGIEGIHYVVVTDENGKYITYPEGIDATNTGYPYGYGFYADTTLEDVYSKMGPDDPNSISFEEQVARAEGRNTQGLGCSYDASAWTTQLQMISDVVAQYKASLECGSAELDTVYPEFIAALEAAGINDIIADKQEFFDNWRNR